MPAYYPVTSMQVKRPVDRFVVMVPKKYVDWAKYIRSWIPAYEETMKGFLDKEVINWLAPLDVIVYTSVDSDHYDIRVDDEVIAVAFKLQSDAALFKLTFAR